MRLGNLDDIKQKWQWLPIMLKMNGNGNEGFVVGGGPRISGKTEFVVIFLWNGKLKAQILYTSKY
jgi:hypothetical protein